MIKSIATLLFSNVPYDKNYAFKALFPRTWASIWGTGYDRGMEKGKYLGTRDAGVVIDDKVQVSSDETLTEHLSQDAKKALSDALQYSGDGQSLKKIVIDHVKAPHSGLMGIAGEEIERGQLVTIRDDGKLYRAASGGEIPAGTPALNIFNQKGMPERTAKPVQPINERDAEVARLCAKYPDYAVAKAKYDQARRNGKKSSHFKAEMDAIRAKDAAGE